MWLFIFYFLKREQTKSLAVFQVGIDGNTGSRGQIAERHLGGAEVENVAVADSGVSRGLFWGQQW